MTVYGDFPTMFDAFEDGKIDITDWTVNFFDEARYAANPDFFLTDDILGGAISEVDVNHHNAFMSIPLQENRGQDGFVSPSTKQPTAAGIEIRRALAHLLDKTSFINGAQIQGQGDYVDIQAPPIQGLSPGSAAISRLPANVLAEDCTAHSWFTPCDTVLPPVSAYNLVADEVEGASLSWGHSFAGLGYSGGTDLRAACDHFRISQLSDIVFSDSPVTDDWQLYTGGWTLGSKPDHLYFEYYSSFASSDCGGKKSTFAQNYLFYCSPAFDEQASLGEFASNWEEAKVHFANATLVAHRQVMTIPVYSAA